MKYVIYTLIAIASALIIYNATILDFEQLLEGESQTAIISILASGCAILLMFILLVSRNINEKHHDL